MQTWSRPRVPGAVMPACVRASVFISRLVWRVFPVASALCRCRRVEHGLFGHMIVPRPAENEPGRRFASGQLYTFFTWALQILFNTSLFFNKKHAHCLFTEKYIQRRAVQFIDGGAMPVLIHSQFNSPRGERGGTAKLDAVQRRPELQAFQHGKRQRTHTGA